MARMDGAGAFSRRGHGQRRHNGREGGVPRWPIPNESVRLRLNVTVVSLVLVAAVVAPMLVSEGYDSFPLSTYPMFAGHRDRVAPIATVVAVKGDEVARLSSELIGGTEEPMLAAETVVHAIRDGHASVLCAEIADRAAARGVRGTLQVVTERYDTLRWFDGDRAPVDRTVHAQCEVPR